MRRFLSKEALGERGSATVKAVASGLAVLALGAGLFHERGLDLFGEARKVVSEKEATERALDDYRTAFRKANPYGKFALQYTEVIEVAVDYREGGTGRGILGFFSSFDTDTAEDYQVEVYNNCLEATPFDRNKAIVRNPVNRPNQITVDPPDHSDKNTLTFDGARTAKILTPADRQTQEILDTYGCEPVEDNIVVAGPYRADFVDSSPVILETR